MTHLRLGSAALATMPSNTTQKMRLVVAICDETISPWLGTTPPRAHELMYGPLHREDLSSHSVEKGVLPSCLHLLPLEAHTLSNLRDARDSNGKCLNCRPRPRHKRPTYGGPDT